MSATMGRCECWTPHAGHMLDGENKPKNVYHCTRDAVRLVTVRPYIPQPGEPIVVLDFGAPQEAIAGHHDNRLEVKVQWPGGREDYMKPEHLGLRIPMCSECASHTERTRGEK